MKKPRTYPVVGGPLDGEMASMKDFHAEFLVTRPMASKPDLLVGDVLRPGGKFHTYADEYLAYNRNGHGTHPTMIWLWKGLLR